MVNNHRTRHAQIVMKRADVRKSPRIRKSDPEACHAEGRLREPKPFLRRRDDEPRVSAVGSGIDDGVPGPVRIDRNVRGRVHEVRRFGPEGNGMRRDRILVIPFDRLPGADFDAAVGKTQGRHGPGATGIRRDLSGASSDAVA